MKPKPLTRIEKLHKRLEIARAVNTNPVEVGVEDLDWLLKLADAALEGTCMNCGTEMQCPECDSITPSHHI